MPILNSSEPLDVVIAGGGVAALEALIALRDLAGDRVRLTLVAPDEDFVYRPLSVGEPFLVSHANRYPLARIADDFRARLVRGSVTEVQPDLHRVRLADGDQLSYDKLVLAPGALPERAYEHAITFGEDDTHAAIQGLLADAELGYIKRIAFVVPLRSVWTLPLYELALMTAADVTDMNITTMEILFVTPEERPLAIFGPQASEQVGELLAEAGIAFIGSAHTEVGQHEIFVRPDHLRLEVDRVVSLPQLVGPSLPGLPSYNDGYIATDDRGRVVGMRDVYAAGDATAFPIKQGGLAAQQADAVATTIAAAAGAPVEVRPFRPVLRGMLLFGRHDKRFLRHGAAGGAGNGEATTDALWWPPTKVAGRYLAPYLFDQDEMEALDTPPHPHVSVDISLDPRGAPQAAVKA